MGVRLPLHRLFLCMFFMVFSRMVREQNAVFVEQPIKLKYMSMTNLFSRYSDKQKEKREQRLLSEVSRRVQVREYKDKAYIALDDIPLVPMQSIEQLKEVRSTIYSYWL